MRKHHCGPDTMFTSMTVARDLCTDAHRDRFNLRASQNHVITVGNFSGGGIWQEGSCEGAERVSIETVQGNVIDGFVSSVRNQVVRVDPKKLHKTMPWSRGPKWTIIARTMGQHEKLDRVHRRDLGDLGFVLPQMPELKAVDMICEDGGGNRECALFDGPGGFPPSEDPEEEKWTCMWLRRFLDKERVLTDVVPAESAPDLECVKEVNQKVAEELDNREILVRDRYDMDQWLTLCKLTESPEEIHGVEALFEVLAAPSRLSILLP